MFKISYDGKKNIIGKNIYKLRKTMFPGMSQRQFAEKLQSYGMDVGKNRISDIESGKSFVTDIEVKVFAMFFNVSTDALLETEEVNHTKKNTISFTEKLGGYGNMDVAQKPEDKYKKKNNQSGSAE